MQSHQAQQIWRLVPEVDQLSARGGVSALARDGLEALLKRHPDLTPYAADAYGALSPLC